MQDIFIENLCAMPEGWGRNPKTLCHLLIQKRILLNMIQEKIRKALSEETPGNSGAISPEWREQAVPE